jgi:hypothetical protein
MDPIIGGAALAAWLLTRNRAPDTARRVEQCEAPAASGGECERETWDLVKGVSTALSRPSTPFLICDSPRPQDGDVKRVVGEAREIFQNLLVAGRSVVFALGATGPGEISQGYFCDAAAFVSNELFRIPGCSVRLRESPPPSLFLQAAAQMSQLAEQAAMSGSCAAGSIAQLFSWFPRSFHNSNVGGTKQGRYPNHLKVPDSPDWRKAQAPGLVSAGPLALANVPVAFFFDVWKDCRLRGVDVPTPACEDGQRPKLPAHWMSMVTALRRAYGTLFLMAEIYRLPRELVTWVQDACKDLAALPDPARSELFDCICHDKPVVRLVPVLFNPYADAALNEAFLTDTGARLYEPGPGGFHRRLAEFPRDRVRFFTQLPFLHSLGEAASMLTFAYSTEPVPGMRQHTPSPFLRPETTTGKKRVVLGKLTRDGTFHSEEYDCFRANIFTCGLPGGGKSNTNATILEHFREHGASILALDPVKSEMSAFVRSIRGPVYDLQENPLNLGLLHLEPTETIYQHTHDLAVSFLAVYNGTQAGKDEWKVILPAIYGSHIAKVLGRRVSIEEFLRMTGRDFLRDPRLVPPLEFFFEEANRQLDKFQSHAQFDLDRRAYFRAALASLAQSPMRYLFDGDLESRRRIFDGNTAINLENVGDGDLKRGVLSAVLLNLRQHCIAERIAGRRRDHFTALDECHFVLPGKAHVQGKRQRAVGAAGVVR